MKQKEPRPKGRGFLFVGDNMKLGISYMVFEGEELLESAARSIRQEVDFISVVYQSTSFTGVPAKPELVKTLNRLKASGLIDQMIHFDTNLSEPFRHNEVSARNVGLKASRDVDCTHHISADVDEFYDPKQLAAAKATIGEADCSVVRLHNYFKSPTYRIVPNEGHVVSFIQKVDVEYSMESAFPILMDLTRRPSRFDKYKVFDLEEFAVHHMTYVRRDIGVKLRGSPNWKGRNLDKFMAGFSNYKVGDRVCVAPDFLNRRTELVADIFGIGELWEHPLSQA